MNEEKKLGGGVGSPARGFRVVLRRIWEWLKSKSESNYQPPMDGGVSNGESPRERLERIRSESYYGRSMMRYYW